VSNVAIDASALIAFLRSEPGADVVQRYLRGSIISAISLSEVFEKTPNLDQSGDRVLALLRNWQVTVVPFEAEQAAIAARIKSMIGNPDISFADRACLAVAQSSSVPALTANRTWMSLSIEAEIILIRDHPSSIKK
jgi:ribonuclease VapC